MSKNCSVFLLVVIFLYLVVTSNCLVIKTIETSEHDTILNKMMITLIENCDLGLQSLIVYDNSESQSTSEALSTLKIPVTKLLMSKIHMIDAVETFYDVKNQGLILASNKRGNMSQEYYDVLFEWRCKKNCSVIIKPNRYDNCLDAEYFLYFMRRMSIYNAYYVCISMNIPLVFTHDSYGDTKPAHWTLFKQKTIYHNTLTLYTRRFREAKTCEGFVFNRSNITRNNSVMLVIKRSLLSKGLNKVLKNNMYDARVKKILFGTGEILDILEKLMKIKFVYFITTEFKSFGLNKSTNHPVDIMFQSSAYNENKYYRYSFTPTYWGSFAIMSHNRGLRTPLEKIGNFYGMWTLSSLIIILIFTFIVIWSKTRKNIALAAFDIIRLLTNYGVSVPIDTLSLKIFFCMIFLYFLVIHATFSGNLAKFLTIPEYRKNIDTIEDLVDPRIKTVYCINHICSMDETLKLLGGKLKITNQLDSCTERTVANSNTACIAVFAPLRKYVSLNIRDSSLYLSKEFMPFATTYTYRKQFILREQFNKALMYMNDIGLSSHSWDEDGKAMDISFAMLKAESEIDFRTVSFEDLKFAFTLLIIGNSLSLICFIIEIIVYRRRRSFQNIWIKTFKRKNINFRRKKFEVTPRL